MTMSSALRTTTTLSDPAATTAAEETDASWWVPVNDDNNDDGAPLLLQPNTVTKANHHHDLTIITTTNNNTTTNNTNTITTNTINNTTNNHTEIRRITRPPSLHDDNDEQDEHDDDEHGDPPRDFLWGISGWKETERDVPSILLALSQTPVVVSMIRSTTTTMTNHNNNNNKETEQDHHPPPPPTTNQTKDEPQGNETWSRAKTTMSPPPQYVPRYPRDATVPLGIRTTTTAAATTSATTTTTIASSAGAAVESSPWNVGTVLESVVPTATAAATTTAATAAAHTAAFPLSRPTQIDPEPVTTKPVTAKKTASETTKKKKNSAKHVSSIISSSSTTTTTTTTGSPAAGNKKGSTATATTSRCRRRRRQRRKRRHTDEDARNAGYNSSNDDDNDDDNDNDAAVTIYELSPNDVLSGRGNGVAFYPGNIQFRTLVQEHKAAYLQAERDDKIVWARTVIAKIQQMQPPGRFLEKQAGMEGRGEGLGVSMAGGGWKIMSPTKALEKTCQALREKLDWKSSAPLATTATATTVPFSSSSSSRTTSCNSNNNNNNTASAIPKMKQSASKGSSKTSKVTTSSGSSGKQQVSVKKGKETVVKRKNLLPTSSQGGKTAKKIIKPPVTTSAGKKVKAAAATTTSAKAVPTMTTLTDADTAAAAAALMLASQHNGVNHKMMMMRNPATAASTMPARLVAASLNDRTALASHNDTSSIPANSSSKTKVAAAPLNMDVDTAASMALARPTEASPDEWPAGRKRGNATTTTLAAQASLASPGRNDNNVNPSQASSLATVNVTNASFQLNAATAATAAMDAHTAAAVLALASQTDVNITTNHGGNAAMHQVWEASSSSSSAPVASLTPSAASVYATVATRHYSAPPMAASLDIAPTLAAATATTTCASRTTAVSRSLPLARPAAMNVKKVKDSKKRASPSTASSPSNNRKKRARKNDAKGPDYDIFEVTHNDVLSGRGNGVAHSPGNIQFREVVLSHKAAYVQTDNLDLKAALAEDVISTITNLTPPGRFLEKNPNGEGWRELTKRQVFAKTCQALREKAHWNALSNGITSSITTAGAAHTPDKVNAKSDGKANDVDSRKSGDSIVPTDISEPSPSSVVSPVASAMATMDDDYTASTVARPDSPATTADASYKTSEAIISPPSSTSKPVKTRTKAKAGKTVKNHKEPPASTLCYQRKQKESDQVIDPNSEYCIFQTSETDVLSGRGNGVAARPGNAYFRRLVYFHKDAYVDADRDGKTAVAQTVIAAIRKLTPPGRFLEKDPNGAGWREMTDRQVFLKTCQALREKTHWGNHAKEANQNFSPSDCPNALVVGTTAAAASSAGSSPNAPASKVKATQSQERLGVESKQKKHSDESKGEGEPATQDTKCSPPPSAAAGDDDGNNNNKKKEHHHPSRSSVSIENGSPVTVANTSDKTNDPRIPSTDTKAVAPTAAAVTFTITTDHHDDAAADTCVV